MAIRITVSIATKEDASLRNAYENIKALNSRNGLSVQKYTDSRYGCLVDIVTRVNSAEELRKAVNSADGCKIVGEDTEVSDLPFIKKVCGGTYDSTIWMEWFKSFR